jgi:2-dehydro-3-deoxyphosphogluconate aldolase / (4S)-4-hydroxy-2-oxoglutarate aldolase
MPMTNRRQELFDLVLRERMVAVVREDSVGNAEQVAHSFLSAGARMVEIVARLAEQASERGAVLAAGSVRNTNDAAEARRAGAQILVSPHMSLPVIEYALEHDLLCIAGAMTPTEIVAAWEAGAGIVKIFPAPMVGGPAYVRAVRQPIRDIPLLAGGPVALESIDDYLDAGAVAVNLGAALALPDLVREGKFDEVSRRVSMALATIAARERKEALVH